jgi:hypothetical protein
MNYDHLKETVTRIKPGSFVLDDKSVVYDNTIVVKSPLRIRYEGQKKVNNHTLAGVVIGNNVAYYCSKAELLVLSDFLRDIAKDLP